jgi:hypoxanthine-DNA glycosylase
MNDTGFSPIIGDYPRVLILGSMPSQKSLEKQEYYGHPQNAFWKIMAQLFDFSVDLNYTKRAKLVSSQGVAIWDVIHSCVRPGSLDSSIQKNTVVENKIPEFLELHSGIRNILCNGGTAYQLFQKHFKSWLSENSKVIIHKMPSTSPAHASLSFDKKFKIWKEVIENAF